MTDTSSVTTFGNRTISPAWCGGDSWLCGPASRRVCSCRVMLGPSIVPSVRATCVPATAVNVTPLNWLDLSFRGLMTEPVAAPRFAAAQGQRDGVQYLDGHVDRLSRPDPPRVASLSPATPASGGRLGWIHGLRCAKSAPAALRFSCAFEQSGCGSVVDVSAPRVHNRGAADAGSVRRTRSRLRLSFTPP